MLGQAYLEGLKLKAEQVRWVCDPESLGFESTEELPPLTEVIGQERAVEAIDFGVQMQSHGFNIFAAGPTGTGRMTFIQGVIEKVARTKPTPDDWCYVYNFVDPYRPKALRLPAGKGGELKRDMEQLTEHLKREIARLFESEDYQKQRQSVIQALQQERDEALSMLERKARERSLALVGTPAGLMVVPVMGGQIITPDQFAQLPELLRHQLEEQRQELTQELQSLMRHLAQREREAREQLSELDKKMAMMAAGHVMDDLREKYAAYPQVIEYLTQVQEDVVNNVDAFRAAQQAGEMPAGLRPSVPDIFERYRVNLLVDNSRTQGAPVIVETNPTFHNLVGRIEYRMEMGAFMTHFTMIRAGALHRANGGYLILDAKDVLSNPFAWDALKRALDNRQVRIEEIGEAFRVISVVSLAPEPIPLDVKVVLVGSPLLYYLLQAYDEDFRNLFKVKADFDVRMERNPQNIRQCALFIAARCKEERLKHFRKDAVAKVIEYSSRLVEDQTKLSTRFLDICDIVRESSYWAGRNGHELVTAEDVQLAVQKRVYRVNLIEERIRELIRDGIIMVDVEGERVGTVNGLAVISLGDHIFGKPSRITARTFLGRSGVVNIEREVQMSGRIHSKGVMILSGYLGGKYARDKPLTLSASLTFEQLYDEVEGDSASSAELYALLSSLSDLPLKQGIAVTGSVNQHGELQPVGGVTYKVEGFFDVCKAKGLTGEQGVIIPAQNVRNLMLREDVVEAVREGKFHIWAVRTVDEGIEILTGVPAGKRQPDGTYPEGTVHYAVEKRLREMAECWKEFQPPSPGREA